MEKKQILFKNKKGLKLSGTYNHVSSESSSIIIMHGFRSDKENKSNWANYLSENNFNVLRFDFTGHGKSEGNLEDITPETLNDDAKSALDYITSKTSGKIGVTGHSLGGLATIMISCDERVNSSSPIAPPTDFSSRKLGLEKFDNESKDMDVISIVKKIKIPMMFIHGDNDTVVPLSDSQNAVKNAVNAKLEIIEGLPHTFDNIEHYTKMIHLSEAWFSETLS